MTKEMQFLAELFSLENNGGFSSIRYKIGNTDITGKTTVMIRLKGDGKKISIPRKAKQ